MLHHAAAMQLSNAAKEQPQGFGLTNLDAMQIIMIILIAFIGDGSMLLGGGLVDPGMNQNNIINQPLPDHLLQQNLQPNDPNIIDPSIIDPSAAGLNAQEQEIVRLTNEYRQRNGLNALTVSHELSVGCRKQAEHPQGGREHCVYPCNGSENIGWNYSSPEAVVQGWIESPEHNLNMLGNHREMGAGWATPESNPHQCQRFR